MDAAHALVIERLHDLRARFAEAHREGMASLERDDLAGFGEAIRREREIIDEQHRLLDAYVMST